MPERKGRHYFATTLHTALWTSAKQRVYNHPTPTSRERSSLDWQEMEIQESVNQTTASGVCTVQTALADTQTPKPQAGEWTLVAPDGRTWKADSPLRVCAAESSERVPADVALARIYKAADEAPMPPWENRANELVDALLDAARKDGILRQTRLVPIARSSLLELMDELAAVPQEVRWALDHAEDWITQEPHGDNCFLHNDGGEFDACFCGRDGALQSIEMAFDVIGRIEPPTEQAICPSCDGTGDAYIPRDGRMASRCGACNGTGSAP